MSDELMELPEGWGKVSLAEITYRITKGTTPTSLGFNFADEGILFVKVESIQNQQINHALCTFIGIEADEALARSRLQEGDVLFSIAGTLGRIAIVQKEDLPANTNQALAIIRLINPIFSHYIAEVLSSHLLAESIKDSGRGVGLQNINLKQVSEFDIPLPPLNEQRRIVAKIEELRERSQKARSHLSAIPNLCDKFRQSVLAAAFRGDLTADWREQNPDVEPASVLLERIRRDRHDRKSPESVDSSQLPELPEGWMWTPLEEIASHRSGIAFKSAEFTNIGIQVIRLSNVYKGQLDLTRDPVFLPDKYAIDSFTLKANDIVVSQTGTRFKRDYGNFVLIPNNCPKLFLNQRLLAVSCHHLINPEYIVFASKLKSYQDHFFSHETGGVNQGNVGVSGVMKGLVPLAPQKEAQILVKRIKTAFEYICRVELIHRRNEDNLNYLDRSILAKAFRGELVEQDPNDEPASVLLDRIRAEREQQAQGKKGKRIMKTTST